jgi:excinuclease ABC subunit C
VLAHNLTFSAVHEGSFFQELPAAAAVFILRGEGEPYASKTANLRRRLQRLLGPPSEQSKRLNLRDRVREIEFTPTGSDFESQFLLYSVLRDTFPKTYAARLRLRPAPLVKLHLENEYPRASVTTRLGQLRNMEGRASSDAHENSRGASDAARAPNFRLSNLYYGPFPSRTAAEKFASDVLDFFKMRRCVDDLHPDPSFPGCVYSEMKMCLAPCFKGCTDEEYQAEVARVESFLNSRGESLTRELAVQRDRASAELAFEEAAAVHAKIEKLKPIVAQLPEIVRRIDRLEAIIIQPSAEPNSVALFHFARAVLQAPTLFSIEQSGEPQSMESRLQSQLAGFPVRSANSTAERNEHLAILKRWYYRSSRIGEIFFPDEKNGWPLRRIVRGIGRVYRGEKEPELTFSATSSNAMPSERT